MDTYATAAARCHATAGGNGMRGAGRWLRALALAGILLLMAMPSEAQESPTSYATSYAGLVARLMPSVVNITVRKMVSADNPAIHNGANQAPDNGAIFYGSGFIIDPSGYILTNRHVVIDSYSIIVALSDGTRLVAHVVGHPPATDLALLKVDAGHALPAIEFGDSDNVRVGDKVLAIGNPLGVGETVTAGIISARNRNIGESPYDNFIQTDASINPGNSGGPLFDLQGKVIGVNTALFGGNKGGSVGLGLAIPSDDALFAARELRQYDEVKPGWIGANLQQITPALAQAFALPGTAGALVGSVDASGPAAQAGLQPGDAILTFDGQAPADVRALMRMIAKFPLDHSATLTVRHDGADRTVPVTIEEYPPALMVANFPFQLSNPPPMEAGDVGLRLAPLSETTRQRFRLPSGEVGIEVTAVPPRSAADLAGLRPGDVVLRVQDQPATTPDSVQQGVQQAQQEGRADVALQIVGPSGEHWVALPLKAAE